MVWRLLVSSLLRVVAAGVTIMHWMRFRRRLDAWTAVPGKLVEGGSRFDGEFSWEKPLVQFTDIKGREHLLDRIPEIKGDSYRRGDVIPVLSPPPTTLGRHASPIPAI